MRDDRCPFCNGVISDPGAKFCSNCGKALTGKVVCPQCREGVAPDNFCAQCGADMRGGSAEPEMRENVWVRGGDDFAMNVPTEMINKASESGLDIRHGSKALFFEEGRLVEEAESGRYTNQEGGFLSRLLGKKRPISAVLIDAGDVEVHFDVGDLKTKDGIFTDIGVDLVLRLEDANSFFVNVMKERKAFKVHELRSMLYGEIRNSLQESVQKHDFDDLNVNLQTKQELASRMEAHLRQTLGRNGFGFGQVRTLSVRQQALDETAKAAGEAETGARKIEEDAKSRRRVGEAEIWSEDMDRGLRKAKMPGAREDIDVAVDEKDIGIHRKKALGEKDIEERFLDAGFLEKRLEVYKKIKETDVETIKTEEDFRKFQLEVDRDRIVDDAEWKEFKDELLWKEEDRARDRKFLVRKIELQQEYDTKRLELVNRKDLELEEKKQELKALDIEQEGEVQRELKRVEGLVKIEQEKARGRAVSDEIERLGKKETEIKAALKDVELEKEKGRARHDLQKLKSELGMSNLERMKALRRQDEHERNVNALEVEQRKLELRLKEESERSRLELDRKRAEGELEKDRIAAISGLDIEQLIAVSDESRAKVLGDLAQSNTLRGMSADEIMAMKDPVSFGKALEERARNTQSEELKAAYDRMLAQAEVTSDKVAEAYQSSADRAERMHSETVRGMAGQQQTLAEAERASANRAERVSAGAMDRMSEAVAGGAVRGGSEGSQAGKVHVCSNCKREVGADKNFCPNCGDKLY